jgi:Flp pilus assembly protein TadD
MGLANGHLRDIFVDAADSREQTLAKGFKAAREAVALDANSSSAHLSLGHAYVWAEDYETAISETEIAVELNPSNAHARMALGNRLDLIGKTPEGIAQMVRSLQLNPRDPSRFNYMGYLARAHITLGEYETALQWARKAVQLRPDQPGIHFRLAICLGHHGRADEAKAALAECEQLQPGFMAKHATWRPYADEGRNEHFFAGLRTLGLFP